jgi:ubiquinone/menaquinone biosynthesis C-methylase UbiE
MMDQKLFLSPIKKDPQNVLDIGTGTGLWAIEFGMSNKYFYTFM